MSVETILAEHEAEWRGYMSATKGAVLGWRCICGEQFGTDRAAYRTHLADALREWLSATTASEITGGPK